MRVRINTIYLLVLPVLLSFGAGAEAKAQVAANRKGPTADCMRTYAYVNGHIWSGEQFIDETLFVREGKFTEKVAKPDTTIDLSGGYIVPAFGDAHTHSLGRGGISVYEGRNGFRRNGIFYAADLTNSASEIISSGSNACAGHIPVAVMPPRAKATSIVVGFSNHSRKDIEPPGNSRWHSKQVWMPSRIFR